MSEPDFRKMGDPLNDRLPPKRRTPRLPCEGSNQVGHPMWPDTIPEVVVCTMCGRHFESMVRSPNTVPPHTRVDILAMLERGDFDNG